MIKEVDCRVRDLIIKSIKLTNEYTSKLMQYGIDVYKIPEGESNNDFLVVCSSQNKYLEITSAINDSFVKVIKLEFGIE